MDFEVAGSIDGSNQVAKMSSGSVTFTQLIVDGRVYRNGNTAYWQQNEKAPANVARAFDGTWVEYPASRAAKDADLAAGSRVRALLTDDIITKLAAVHPKPEEVLQGTETLYAVYEAAELKGSRVVISPKNLKVVAVELSGSSPATFAFDKWDEVEHLQAPEKFRLLPKQG